MLDLGHAWRRFVRLPVAILYAALLLPTLWQTGDSARASENPQWSVAIFDSDPDHLWNRLYAALWLREDTRGTRYGNDTLDPPLWLESENLLSQPSHSRALQPVLNRRQMKGRRPTLMLKTRRGNALPPYQV